MTWWNETGTLSGWAGGLPAVAMLLAFWRAVAAAPTALPATTAPPRRP